MIDVDALKEALKNLGVRVLPDATSPVMIVDNVERYVVSRIASYSLEWRQDKLAETKDNHFMEQSLAKEIMVEGVNFAFHSQRDFQTIDEDTFRPIITLQLRYAIW